MRSIFWFRRDLRLHDNTALYHALKSGTSVVPIFIFDTDILEQLEDRDDARVTFIHESLELIQKKLKGCGSSLHVYHGRPVEIFSDLLKNESFDAVFLNHDYEPYAIERDIEVQLLCVKQGVKFQSFKDHVIFEKLEVTKADGLPYSVFTPYKNAWRKQFAKSKLQLFPSEKLQSGFAKSKPQKIPSLSSLGFRESSISVPEPSLAHKTLSAYAENRNFPAIEGTTKIGVHLRFGTISIREAVKKAKQSEVWLDELIWREFFMQILFNSPEVIEHPAKPKYRSIVWRNSVNDFKKWCEGKTGFPIVDAGMRELNATGFIHNRARMIAASLLVKTLLIDYRWGEKYFAQKLLDFELASNNGNWQWVAGTGSDAAPYFRIFSPEAQQKKFDPEFKYIRKWIPEFGTAKYPKPIVNDREAKVATLEAYRKSIATRS